VRLRELIEGGELPYQDRRQAQEFLDRIGAPYVLIRRERHYRRDDIRRAIEETEIRALVTA
jgi:hypothetical protein